jgi:hypothetical protein
MRGKNDRASAEKRGAQTLERFYYNGSNDFFNGRRGDFWLFCGRAVELKREGDFFNGPNEGFGL